MILNLTLKQTQFIDIPKDRNKPTQHCKRFIAFLGNHISHFFLSFVVIYEMIVFFCVSLMKLSFFIFIMFSLPAKETCLIRLFNGHEIHQRRSDGYICITEIARAHGKDVSTYNRRKKTKAFKKALESTMQSSLKQVIYSGSIIFLFNLGKGKSHDENFVILSRSKNMCTTRMAIAWQLTCTQILQSIMPCH